MEHHAGIVCQTVSKQPQRQMLSSDALRQEGFAGLDLSASAAQSVVLMFLVIILTVVQFRYVESKVRYQ